MLRGAWLNRRVMRSISSVVEDGVKDPLLWKMVLVAALIYVAVEVAGDELLAPDTEAKVKAPILGLLAATGIAINMIYVVSRAPTYQGSRRDLTLLVNGVTGAVIATTGWFAAQQWLLTVSVANSHYPLMGWLASLALAGVYLGFLSQPSR